MKKMLFLLVPLMVLLSFQANAQTMTTTQNSYVTVNITEYLLFTIAGSSAGAPYVYTIDENSTSPVSPVPALNETWTYRSNTTAARRIFCSSITDAIDPTVADANNFLDLRANFTVSASAMTTPPTSTGSVLICGGSGAQPANIDLITGLTNGTANGAIVYALTFTGNPHRPTSGTYAMTITYTCTP